MSTKQKKIGDVTRTARAKAHLERLDEAKGKRLVIDLDAAGLSALESLLAAGYAPTQKGVVITALLAASASLQKKT